jgi:hypothetical protein
MINIKEKLKQIISGKNIKIAFLAVGIILVITAIVYNYSKRPVNIWYVEQGLEEKWAKVLQEAQAPEAFKETRTWDGVTIPAEGGILIATKPWKNDSKVSVYHRLAWDLEYQGAVVLALDPWMIFRKHTDPSLTVDRVLSDKGGKGILLLPGRDMSVVRAWTGRFIQDKPGNFPSGNAIWREWEEKLFVGSRFPNGSMSYTWSDAMFRLMGRETAWIYAPLSYFRRYNNPQKAILEASAFPEFTSSGEYSMQAEILWALPTGSEKKQKKLVSTINWLKNPNTQTIIANTFDWIPADPYGKPYDPMSFTSHRLWLTADWVYTIEE